MLFHRSLLPGDNPGDPSILIEDSLFATQVLTNELALRSGLFGPPAKILLCPATASTFFEPPNRPPSLKWTSARRFDGSGRKEYMSYEPRDPRSERSKSKRREARSSQKSISDGEVEKHLLARSRSFFEHLNQPSQIKWKLVWHRGRKKYTSDEARDPRFEEPVSKRQEVRSFQKSVPREESKTMTRRSKATLAEGFRIFRRGMLNLVSSHFGTL
ncbi:hypothetical protein KM043_005402 [Ampulex compressa]|nr:hypothetical protein KM043_005402 [Ampulex compressa]